MDLLIFAGDGERLQAPDSRSACRPETCWVCHLCPESHQGKYLCGFVYYPYNTELNVSLLCFSFIGIKCQRRIK